MILFNYTNVQFPTDIWICNSCYDLNLNFLIFDTNCYLKSIVTCQFDHCLNPRLEFRNFIWVVFRNFICAVAVEQLENFIYARGKKYPVFYFFHNPRVMKEIPCLTVNRKGPTFDTTTITHCNTQQLSSLLFSYN